MSRIAVVGTGYVGPVAGAGLAQLGHQVTCLDSDRGKISLLRGGQVPFYEPNLEELIDRNRLAGLLHFTPSYSEAIPGAEFIFITVGTRALSDGLPDLSALVSAVQTACREATAPATVVIKSTVPVGTCEQVQALLTNNGLPSRCTVAANPEFLRQGSAVVDFLHPWRIVIGAAEPETAARVARLYAPHEQSVLITDLCTAEMIKYVANAFLAVKISFINQIAEYCDASGVDICRVAQAVGVDPRIGHGGLQAGLGWGGSCLPKDLQALIQLAEAADCRTDLLRAAAAVNHRQWGWAVTMLRQLLGDLSDRTVGVLGLAFKPGTDDIREAPALKIIETLYDECSNVKAYDPAAMPRATDMSSRLMTCPDPYALAHGCDALVICTEWDEFKKLDWRRMRKLMRGSLLLDGRNILDPQRMRDIGFRYLGIGRSQGWEGKPTLSTEGVDGSSLNNVRPLALGGGDLVEVEKP